LVGVEVEIEGYDESYRTIALEEERPREEERR
jgi:hypothetical protein